jgi:hypothetical protein
MKPISNLPAVQLNQVMKKSLQGISADSQINTPSFTYEAPPTSALPVSRTPE